MEAEMAIERISMTALRSFLSEGAEPSKDCKSAERLHVESGVVAWNDPDGFCRFDPSSASSDFDFKSAVIPPDWPGARMLNYVWRGRGYVSVYAVPDGDSLRAVTFVYSTAVEPWSREIVGQPAGVQKPMKVAAGSGANAA